MTAIAPCESKERGLKLVRLNLTLLPTQIAPCESKERGLKQRSSGCLTGSPYRSLRKQGARIETNPVSAYSCWPGHRSLRKQGARIETYKPPLHDRAVKHRSLRKQGARIETFDSRDNSSRPVIAPCESKERGLKL